jgi:hypothetical protein
MGKGIGAGITSSVINFGISQGENALTEMLANDVESEREENAKIDSMNNISIVANDA